MLPSLAIPTSKKFFFFLALVASDDSWRHLVVVIVYLMLMLLLAASSSDGGVGDEVVCNSRRPYELMLSNSFKVKSTMHHGSSSSSSSPNLQPAMRMNGCRIGWLNQWLVLAAPQRLTLNCDQRFGCLMFKLKLDMLYNIFRWPFKVYFSLPRPFFVTYPTILFCVV